MKVFSDIERVYFIGAGGIGMSALVRYMLSEGLMTGGYDRVETGLTRKLEKEGLSIHYEDNKDNIPLAFRNPENCLVVYTPAIPSSHKELNFFREKGFHIVKRAEALGIIMSNSMGIGIAGTHGKTTVSSMVAHLMNNSETQCNAFLGGISKNLDSNLLLNKDARYTVAEADEFDRSFLHLFPHIGVVTSIDADHLDVYGSYENLFSDFNAFTGQIKENGFLLHRYGLAVKMKNKGRSLSFDLEDDRADYYLRDIRRNGFSYTFSLKTPNGYIRNLTLGMYGKVNLLNAVAAMATALLAGVKEQEISTALASFAGVKRRFDVQIEEANRIYIDDYAHHPEELKAFISSVKEALPGEKITGIFQPHLYSRTRDFAEGFAESLSLLDDVVLLDIYPAREEAIPGVSREIIFDRLTNKGKRIGIKKEELPDIVAGLNPKVTLSMGAGDIDQYVETIKNILESQRC